MDISKLLDTLPLEKRTQVEKSLDEIFSTNIDPIERSINTTGPMIKDSLFKWVDIDGNYICSFQVKSEHFHFFKNIKRLSVYGLPGVLKDGKYWCVKVKNGNQEIPLGEDIIPYKYGEVWRTNQGIQLNTIIPQESQEEIIAETELNKNKLQEILNLRKKIENQKKDELNNPTATIIGDEVEFTTISGLTFEEKSDNIVRFCSNIEQEIFDVFKGAEECEINKTPYGKFVFSMFVKKDSLFDIKSKKIVACRNKSGRIKVDCTDGELLVVSMYNRIFEYLQLDKRFTVDMNSYKNMGDDGDFRAGTLRFDIKTRNKKNGKLCNLLIDEPCIKNGYNEFGLVHRVGDLSCNGEQERRLEFVGVIETAEVLQKNPNGPAVINHRPKYEVKTEDLHCITQGIIRTLLELMDRKDI